MSPRRLASLALGLVVVSVVAVSVSGQTLPGKPGKRPAPKLTTAPRPVDCARASDVDGDGFASSRCGGPDCNDDDRYTFPGNNERCDGTLHSGQSAANHDEDCNPLTIVGDAMDGDADGDGFISPRCANPLPPSFTLYGDTRRVRATSSHVLGADCDDDNAAIVPGAMSCVDDTTVRVCLKSGLVAKALADPRYPPSAVVPSNDLAFGAIRLRCPSGTRCLTQPNGTGVCAR